MRPIFLIGYMGSGKTTLGRAVSAKLGMEFIDLDIFIEARYHQSVKEVFAQYGEDGFRHIEQNILHEVSDFEDVIVSCGGGTPCHFDNMEFMKTHGTTVFLKVSVERLVERLTLPGSKSKRPLVADKTDTEVADFVTESLGQRTKYYEKADITFDASKLEDCRQIDASAEALKEILVKR